MEKLRTLLNPVSRSAGDGYRQPGILVAILIPTVFASIAGASTPPLQPPEGAEVTPSGLASQVLVTSDKEKSPDVNDLVMAHFVGWSPQGEEFQNTYLTGQPQLFNLEQVFPGWREGLGLMVIGEKRRLWIPEHLGASNPTQGPRGAAVFDVELLAIKSVPNPPRSGVKPPPDAERLSLGAFTRVSVPGKGEERPASDSRVLVNYIGWGADGRIFDSTLHRNRPTAFLLDMVMPAFSEALQKMVVGERRYLWIPGRIAAGQWPKAPKGNLLFEVELLRILQPEELQIKPKAES